MSTYRLIKTIVVFVPCDSVAPACVKVRRLPHHTVQPHWFTDLLISSDHLSQYVHIHWLHNEFAILAWLLSIVFKLVTIFFSFTCSRVASKHGSGCLRETGQEKYLETETFKVGV